MHVFHFLTVQSHQTWTCTRKWKLQDWGGSQSLLKVSADHNQVIKRITETFPRLANQGFVLRAKVRGYNADMNLLKYASGKELRFYDVEELRKREICGTSILYVRPVQIKLDLTPLTRGGKFLRT